MSDGVFVLEGTSWREPRSVDRPLAISFIGDEKRSLFVPLGCQNDSTVRIAFEYPEQRGGFAVENRAGLLGAGWDVQRAALVPDLLDSISPEPGISMDITSMTRPMLAATVAALVRTTRPIVVEFLYAPSKFLPPGEDSHLVDPPHPIGPDFVGRLDPPDRPLILVLGLGYEPDRALGSLEYLEPVSAWAFEPMGPDERFLNAVRTANSDLIESIGLDHVIRYSLEDPAGSFAVFDSFLGGAMDAGRPLLLPMGPRLFTLYCLLSSAAHGFSLPVWRLTRAASAKPSECDAAGVVCSLTVGFGGAAG